MPHHARTTTSPHCYKQLLLGWSRGARMMVREWWGAQAYFHCICLTCLLTNHHLFQIVSFDLHLQQALHPLPVDTTTMSSWLTGCSFLVLHPTTNMGRDKRAGTKEHKWKWTNANKPMPTAANANEQEKRWQVDQGCNDATHCWGPGNCAFSLISINILILILYSTHPTLWQTTALLQAPAHRVFPFFLSFTWCTPHVCEGFFVSTYPHTATSTCSQSALSLLLLISM